MAFVMLLTIAVLAPNAAAKAGGDECGPDDCCESDAPHEDGLHDSDSSEDDCPCEDDCPGDCSSCNCGARVLAVDQELLAVALHEAPFERSSPPECPAQAPAEGARLSIFRPPRS